MESLRRSFSTTSVDTNRAWRSKIYDVKVDGSPDLRKDVKTARFGESPHGRFSKIKKLFNFNGSSQEQDTKKSKSKSPVSSKMASSRNEFESRLMLEIYKNMSASHELASMYN